MKVLHIISGGETGGSRKHVTTLLDKLPRDQVCLLVFQEGALAQEARDLGVRVELLSQYSRYDIRVLKRLTNFINEEGFDIVHSHGPRSNLYMSLIKSSIKATWVTTIHSDPTLDFMKGGIKGRIFTKLNLFTFSKIDHFFAVTERFKNNLIQLGIYSNKISVIYNGIDFVEPLLSNSVVRDELNIPHDHFVMSMVARLHPIKGHDIVLKALKQVNNPNISLLLVGDGPIKQEVEDLVQQLGLQNQVHMLGFRKDIEQIYSNSNIALLASQSESFPLALLEAANQKVPLLSTDVGGVNELIPSKEYGWVVPIQDVDAFAQAIQEAYVSNDLKKKGEKQYQFAKDHFSLDQLAKSIWESYTNLS
ncbi:glycosyltransferase family 4 protein [Peribacillus acanthi]|uniref:glycosyltransferase family 4 protein n=1 Tax=Peribacillus acanthi TaxID=2171554 RepID=UPI000D3E58B7|nr:glycosyltransferase family 4 protein [Peribacillus acanthi]